MISAPTTTASYQPLLAVMAILTAAGVSAALLASGEPVAAGVVAAMPAIPFVLFALIRGVAGDRTYGPLLAVAAIVVLSAVFRFRDYADKSIDLQVMLKLTAVLFIAGLSALHIRSIARDLYLYGLAYWLSFYGVMLLSTLYAPNFIHAAFSTVSLLASFLFVSHLCVRYGPDRLVDVLVWSGLVLFATSLVVYVAIPSFGRMHDWYGNELIVTSRLQGILGTSNGAGLSGAIVFFLTLAWYLPRPGASRIIGYSALVTAFLCLVLSNNRMALASLVFALIVYFIANGRSAWKLILVASAGTLALTPLLLFPDEILGLLSRSGDAEEITSATGRTRIWAVVLELIPGAPLLGRGYASAQHFLPLHPDLFLAAAHAHNLYLEVLFSCGLIGLGLLAWCILTTIVLAARTGATRELALFSLFLPYGLTEPIIGGPTHFALIVWQAGVVLLFYRTRQIHRRKLARLYGESAATGGSG